MKRKTIEYTGLNAQHTEIMDAIGKLYTRMSVQETKMDEIIRRVGIQNGRVGDGEALMKKLREEMDYQKGGRNTAKYIVALIIAILGILATLYGLGAIK